MATYREFLTDLVLPIVSMSGLGYVSGSAVSEDDQRPQAVYVQDLNEDHRQDITIKLNDGSSVVYLGMDNGTYKLASSHFEAEQKVIEDKANTLEEKAQSLSNTHTP